MSEAQVYDAMAQHVQPLLRFGNSLWMDVDLPMPCNVGPSLFRVWTIRIADDRDPRQHGAQKWMRLRKRVAMIETLQSARS
jgi:hypothetical protein